MQTKTIILNLINDNPGGLTLTEISQKTKLGENLSLIPTVAKRYVLGLVCDGLIFIEGKGGTYSITDKGISELELSTEPAPNQIAPISDEQELSIEKHAETIICPECNGIQEAEVLHTFPYATYIHDCIHCGYTIMESEWNKVTDTPKTVTSRYAEMKQKLRNWSIKIKTI